MAVDLQSDSSKLSLTLSSATTSEPTWFNNDFIHGLTASFAVIMVSEIGDKTFFIACILAMKYSRSVVFAGAMLALGSMHSLSCVLGLTAIIIPRWITYYVSALLFALFGIKMLKEAYQMSPDDQEEEFKEAQDSIKEKEEQFSGRDGPNDVETARPPSPARSALFASVKRSRPYRLARSLFSPIFMQAFVLTFLAEWGDRSQMTTIVLAARESVWGVLVGGLAGHFLCTGGAVLGGRLITARISVRSVTFAGGVVFVLFALSALFISPDSNS
jgi:putative Ca2+/H+ antiporter (TMEM165/GDT1 family)